MFDVIKKDCSLFQCLKDHHADCQPDEVPLLEDSSSPYTKELLRKEPQVLMHCNMNFT